MSLSDRIFLFNAGGNSSQSFLPFLTSNIPVIEQVFHETEEQFGFIRFNIDYHVDVFLHMSTNVTDLPNRFYGFEALFRHATRRVAGIELFL